MARIYLDKTAKIELTDVFNVKLTLGDGTEYERVELRRLFPVSNKEHWISLIDESEHEIAMIRDFDDLTVEAAAAVKACFNDYYLIPKITKITECNDSTGMLKISGESDRGPVSFRIRNRHSDMKVFPPDRVLLRDADDNRYEIEHFDALDKKSILLLSSFL